MTEAAVKTDTITRKYVILRQRGQDRFIAGCIVQERYHADIFGERPQEVWGDDWYLYSAGYYTWDWQKPDTLRVHGRSEGFLIGPNHHDAAILRGYLDKNNRATEYDHEGNPLE